jgi:hypothetical protein
MPAYVMITHMPKGTPAGTLLALERRAVRRIERECPNVDWVATYEIEGSGDYLDIFRAPDLDTARRVSALSAGPVHATADLWPAAEWPDFRALVHSIQQAH